jgi:hypothetical protein
MATNPVTRMALAALACSLVISLATAGRSPLAVLLGMTGPLAAALVSWRLIARAHRRSPESASAVMIKLFGAKMLFFGAYVAAAILSLPPQSRIPFVVSFVGHYILLHLVEALCLRRLFLQSGAVRGVDGKRLSVS